MEIDAALLCDAATIREGLLHLLGGPITRVWRPKLPAPLGIAFAAILSMTPEELALPHEVAIMIRNEEHVIARVMGAVQGGAGPLANIEPGEMLLAPTAVALHDMGTDRYGRHTLSVSIDHGAAERDIHFWVLHPQEQLLPPMH